MMNEFEDLREMAAGANHAFLPQFFKRYVIFLFVALPGAVLLLYPPIFGLTGWGIAGGIAGVFMSATIIVAGLEIHFLVKGE